MMAHLFEGEPDGRQSMNSVASASRFRPRYRALTDAEKQIHDEIKEAASRLEQHFECVKDGRYKALAMTSLEQAVMWIVKELTS